MNRRGLFKFLGGAAAAAPAIVAVAASTEGAQRRSQGPPRTTGQTFVVEELFGVSHPDQLLSFAGALNPATQKVLKDGAEVPYQVDGNNTIVRAVGGVAANSTHTWIIAEGPRSALSQVSITDGGDHWLMDNGLVAVRVAKNIAVGSPIMLDQDRVGGRLPPILAPIQGVRHRNGIWTGTGPNYLRNARTFRADFSQGSLNFPATSATVTVLEAGPLRAKIRVAYGYLPSRARIAFDAPINPGGYTPPGSGYYNCTITLWAGQQSIIVEEEFDARPEYYLDMNTGVNANTVRYRGQGGGADNYPSSHSRAPDFDHEMALGTTERHYAPLYIWYTWGTENGYYWQAFNSGTGDSNMWGVFQGPTTKTDVGHGSAAGVRPYTNPAGAHGIHVFHGAVYKLDRKYAYGIFLGRKATDVPADRTVNPGVAKAMNIHSGTASLQKQLGWGLTFPDPAGGYAGMHLSRADMEALIAALVNNTYGIFTRLWNDDAQYRPLWEAIADTTNVRAAQMVGTVIADAALAIDEYVNNGTIYGVDADSWMYWMGQTRFQAMAVRANALLVLDQVRPLLSAAQKGKIKAALSLAGHVLWDNDFVPIDNWADGFHLGSPNMPIQFNEGRRQIAVMLKDHSQFAPRAAIVTNDVVNTFPNQINAAGAPIGSPHYAGATIIPATDVLRQLQIGGIKDVFAPASSIHSRLVNVSEWCMQVLSPRQARFGNRRKMVCYGDGSHEAHDHFLSLIMGLEPHNLTLSKRMMGAWTDMGQPLSSFYGSSGLKVRYNFPSQDPALGDADFSGYMSVMRSGWNTADESAVFLLHGDWFIDHYNAERGSPSIFLLGAPISVMYGSLYNPHIGGPYSASTYIPVSKIPGTWNNMTGSNEAILNAECGDHSTLFMDTYTWSPTANRVDLTCNFSVSGWQRKLTFYRDVVTQPIVRLRDSDTVSGDSVFSLNMMASGAVTKPDNSTETPTTLNGTPYAISSGARWIFTGQWGVSWDVYYFGPAAEAFVGYWSHNWHPSREMDQYRDANGGAPFEEKQYILRIKTAGPSDVVIVPYRTGQRRADLNLTQVGGGLQLMGTARMLSD
jgi:hypothetical protein